jgi:ferritin-like metal-binding protein YciE
MAGSGDSHGAVNLSLTIAVGEGDLVRICDRRVGRERQNSTISNFFIIRSAYFAQLRRANQCCTQSGLILEVRGKYMDKNSLRGLFIDELKDIFSAENQITKALPKMAKAASSDELREGFEEHLEQTEGQIERLQQIFEKLGEKPTGKKCMGMEGLLKEGAEVMSDDFEDAVLDAGLISAAQRVEHYEIAAYGSVIAFAELLGEDEAVSLLKETLEEEKETDEKLTELSQDINQAALGDETDAEGEEVDKEEEQPKRKSRKVA